MSIAKAAVTVLVLAVLWTLEGLAPMFIGRRGRVRHDLTNLALGAINALVVALIFAAVLAGAATWAQHEGFGLLHRLDAPAWIEWPAAIVMFDLWMYVWHVANHKVPFFWRFHAVHHSDAELDASSALRFHTGEIVLSSIARLAVVPLLGLTVTQLLVYELILQPIILFHHSNVRVPAGLDRALRWIIVTPRMHWVHHSDWRPETDSNYSSVFSVWDRLFRTFRLRARLEDLRLGLRQFADEDWRRLSRMLVWPLRRRR